MEFSIDLAFMVLTLGCVVFLLQTLIDYNKQAAIFRPKMNNVARIKANHKEAIEKVKRQIDEVEKDSGRFDDEFTELEAKRAELDLVASELRSKVGGEEE